MLLLENAAVGNGPATLVKAGRYALAVWGTSIGQATVTLQRQMPNDAWASIGATGVLTALGQTSVELVGGFYRVAVTDGGTDPEGLYVSLDRF